MLISLLFLSSTAFAASPSTLANTGCASTSGFDGCMTNANNKLSACINQANRDGSQVELLACNCELYVDTINCYAANCWNRVWECAYQDYVVGYMQNCLTAKLPVPYFPIPDGAQDACSCNLGKVFMGMQNSVLETTPCTNAASGGPDPAQNVQKIQACECCEISGALSSIVEICPTTDPTLIGLNYLAQLQQNTNTPFNTCVSFLDQYSCAGDLGYSIDGVSSFIGPNDPLTTGTATLSNGAGVVATPYSGSIFTWTNAGDGVVYTVQAADVQDNQSSKPTATHSAGGGSTTTSTAQSVPGKTSASGSGASQPSPSASQSGACSWRVLETSSIWLMVAALACLAV